MSLDLRELPELKHGKKPVLPAVPVAAIRELPWINISIWASAHLPLPYPNM